ncbi:hypothetical protein DERF_004237 [Dermatophagoides farinae]|uniref:Uncharacterized protein n=1 Tax=Dermatophagoides farinae TaxID=6954 RepID=A0A922I6W5_DERFA|nr:hypothetical protein DERF_004237 [Dermatophagoides farinae]
MSMDGWMLYLQTNRSCLAGHQIELNQIGLDNRTDVDYNYRYV